MTDKERELLKKLKALSERGIGGEKINAEQKLNELMNKLGITSDELEFESEQKYTIKLKKRKYTSYKFEKALFFQILENLFDPLKYDEIKGYIEKNEVIIWLKPKDAIEVKARYDFYSDALYNDFDIFYTSFIYANDLFSQRKATDDDITEEKMEIHKKAILIKSQFEHVYLKQIACKKEEIL